MVLLTVTPAAKTALDEYCKLRSCQNPDGEEPDGIDLTKAKVGSPLDHLVFIKASKYLLQYYEERSNPDASSTTSQNWRLDTLLKGATVYQPSPPPKPEPTPEYKALMQRLRKQEEQRQYERMLKPPLLNEAFKHRFPNAPTAFEPALSHGHTPVDTEIDEVTLQDVNRQMVLIINVLVSIIACAVTIWFAARRWDVPQRLGLSMSGSGLVAAAEVAIYLGYIRRIKDAKEREVAQTETKEVVETWVIDPSSEVSMEATAVENVRRRKGKHR